MSNPVRHARLARLRIGAVLLILCLPAWWLDRRLFLAAWLAAWCFCLGVALGGLVSVWIHNLTGGAWGESIHLPLLNMSRLLPWLALLFLPVLVGVSELYPWAASGDQGDARWAAELSAPAFKRAWLQGDAFVLRAIGILILWNFLAWASRRPALARSGTFAAIALILYGVSVGVAAVDWIMSLMPLWYSSIFGLEVALGQAMAGMACAILLVCRQPNAVSASTRKDLGNLLFTYVLMWAYMAFSQFLIIWSENLPHEIAWYVARRDGLWFALGLAVVAFHFALPLVLLLFRAVKESPLWLAWLTAGLLGAHLLEMWWLILPSVATSPPVLHLFWLLPLSALGLVAVCYGLMPVQALEFESPEVRHA